MTDTTSSFTSARAAATGRLFDMLRTCRPHGGTAEHLFMHRFLLPLGAEADGFGNLWLRIGDAPLLWSSHVDTCHRRDGVQEVQFDQGDIVSLSNGSASNCLGADCTAGVWLMTEMIAAGVPGLYVFHRGEERGGLGSRYVATYEPNRLQGLNAAIAFDRRGTTSIITHQSGVRCCSETFAASLAGIINLEHSADPTGTFTDTANYRHLVGECTNLSVGYVHEHTAQETLDLGYLLRLRDSLVDADWTRLVFDRHPADPDCYEIWGGHHDWDHGGRRRPTVYDLVRDHPHAVADFLELNGVSAAELSRMIEEDLSV